ncbi:MULTISPECIES: hypothetical protein [Pseudoalteromonas]|jgi:hypothetical protein|uniref:Anti-sigma factor n=1 Tax=Pseudoalteromonas lipolytica TaxID=570156 RepID=A0ABY1GLI9_9GAMM|nr:hypothetical protein [Pseudoalteromonas lipolytica]MBE0349579.1 hypothetical protein [Pseudoalteromonas lipolytica LMEB 39]SFT77605.1 hypothetical protein SAMN04487854_109143 [Pseudoalteromonas lipolytica]
MANLESLFTAWLEGESLTEEQIRLLESNPDYALMMENATKWQQHSLNYQQLPVPDWDRGSCMPQAHKQAVYFGSGLWAMAASIALCAWLLITSPEQTDSQLLEQVAKQTRLLESQQKQIDQLQNMLTAQNDIQQQHMYQLAKEAIKTGRVERQEDIASVLAYIKTQRAQDQAYLRMQLNDLAEQVDGRPMPTVANNVEY